MSIIDFFGLLEESITIKKILFRQNQLSDMVHHQNKTKYQRLFEENDQKHGVVPRINASVGMRMSKSAAESRLGRRNEEEAPPAYNSLNYTDFGEESQFQSVQSKNYSKEEAKVVRLTHTKYN